jgi:hypothetical protein
MLYIGDLLELTVLLNVIFEGQTYFLGIFYPLMNFRMNATP